jgi:putative tricarboxylic transport membrane protein
MKKASIVAAIISFVIGICIITIAMTFPKGSNGVPGPGMFPIIIATIIILSSVAVLIRSLRMEKKDDKEVKFLSADTKRAYITMAILAIYFIVLPFIGFCVSTALLMLVLIKWFSKKNIIQCSLISLIITLAIFLVFSKLLNVPLHFGLLI